MNIIIFRISSLCMSRNNIESFSNNKEKEQTDKVEDNN